jgi:hypothetical protein
MPFARAKGKIYMQHLHSNLLQQFFKTNQGINLNNFISQKTPSHPSIETITTFKKIP